MKAIFDELCVQCSRLTTRSYSTSFCMGISCLGKQLRDPIYTVYGFVRFADEIVDTFHQYNRTSLFERFRRDTREALADRISVNPILNAFQDTVHRFKIEQQLIDRFLRSMEMDLYRKGYDEQTFREYVVGSAEAVGLMCLRVFSQGDQKMYHELSQYAMSLGSAFQKLNFLRDLQADLLDRGRIYFPNMRTGELSAANKNSIEQSIEKDFAHALIGIKKLPRQARFGVYVAFMYYLALFKKIKNTHPSKVFETRIRIANRHKATLLACSYVKHQLNMI
jgi:15-cis-phytoene synthase